MDERYKLKVVGVERVDPALWSLKKVGQFPKFGKTVLKKIGIMKNCD